MSSQRSSFFDPDATELRAVTSRIFDDFLRDTQTPSAWQWRAMPDDVRAVFATPLIVPSATPLGVVYDDFLRFVAPYASGNRHSGFLAYVQGAGTSVGAMAELLAASLNMNCGGRDHVGIALERQIALTVGEWFAFPQTSVGVFTTGASSANFQAVLSARTAKLGASVRVNGLQGSPTRLTAYAARGVHSCVVRAMEMSGIGSAALRLVDSDTATHRINVGMLRDRIARDIADGFTPFLVVATAGSVDVGAFDDLVSLADVCTANGMWLHVDGAFGALGVHSARVRSKLVGLQRADSVALDFHKWMQIPYDAGFLIVADGRSLEATFASPAAYLSREQRGLSSNVQPWPTDYCMDLSRGCRALKVWFVLRVFGVESIRQTIDNSLDLALALKQRIAAHAPTLELCGPSDLNIVCFRHTAAAAAAALDADTLNREIVLNLQEKARVIPSLTRINGQLVIRAAVFNHRSTLADIEALVEGVVHEANLLLTLSRVTKTTT